MALLLPFQRRQMQPNQQQLKQLHMKSQRRDQRAGQQLHQVG